MKSATWNKTRWIKKGVLRATSLRGHGYAWVISAMIATGVGLTVTWNAMVRENTAFVQQSIGDTATLLASQSAFQLQSILERISEIRQDQVQPTVNPVTGMMETLGRIETHPTITDVSRWQFQPGMVEPVRIFAAINLRSPKTAAPDFQTRLMAAETLEKKMLSVLVSTNPSPKDSVVLKHREIDSQGLGFLILPVLRGGVVEVYTAHFDLAPLQASFKVEGMASAFLMDSRGQVIAGTRPDSTSITTQISVIHEHMRANQSASGQEKVQDQEGHSYFAGYHRVGFGGLTVASFIAEEEASRGVQMARLRLFGVMILIVLFGMGIYRANRGARWIKQVGSLLRTVLSSPAVKPFLKQVRSMTPSEMRAPERRVISVVAGTIRQLADSIDHYQPDDVIESFNDFYNMMASRVEVHGGIFERRPGGGFVGIFGAVGGEMNEPGTSNWTAIQCALELRGDFQILNQSRKTDGKRDWIASFGVASGAAIVGRFGPHADIRYSAASEAPDFSAALAEQAAAASLEIVVAGDLWQQYEGRLIGTQLAEAKLKGDGGLCDFYAITGYRDEKGQEVQIHSPEVRLSAPAAEKRWLINNGSQIVGPFLAREIAHLLFTQEIDFDAECWVEGTGQSAQIRNAGVFSGSNDEDAGFFVFDGDMIHGPVSHGFIKTALTHGAISPQAYFCEGTTVLGWKSLGSVEAGAVVNTGFGEKELKRRPEAA